MSEHRPNCKCAECENGSTVTVAERLESLESMVSDLGQHLDRLTRVDEAKVEGRIAAARLKVETAMLVKLDRLKMKVAEMEARRRESRAVHIVADPDLMPVRATAGAAGFDLKAAINVDLDPGQRTRVPTGVRIALPPSYEAQVRPRSGLSLRGLDVALGTLDEDYRGEISVVVVNNTGANYAITRGDRIAQLAFARVAPVELVSADALDETVRGENGFGHSGMR